MTSFIAQVGSTIEPFAHYGLIGAVVGWLCLRVEKRLDRIEHTIKGLSAALLMDLASRKTLGPTAQRMVEDMLKGIGVDPQD